MSLWRRLVVVVGVAGVSGCVAGCGSGSSGEWSGAPPTIICGTTLWTGANGAAVNSVWQSYPAQISDRRRVLIRVSRDCSTGSQVTLDPSAGATITTTAKAADGGLAAVVLLLGDGDGAFTVTAVNAGHVVGRLTVRP